MKVGIGIVIVVAVAASLLLFAGYQSYQQSLSSSYRYRIAIDGAGTVTNATFIVPLPFSEDGQEIGDEIVAGNLSGIPEGWQLAVLTSEDAHMLKLSFEEYTFEGVPLPMPLEGDAGEVATGAEKENRAIPVRMEVSLPVAPHINTAEPFGNEPLLYPKSNLTRVPCPFPSPAARAPECFSYQTLVMARFDGPPELTLEVELIGENTWWVGGWSGNSYRDQVLVILSPGEEGWREVSGSLVTGEGRYSWL
ncbi:MAG: hypothetical protein RQ758_07035 [Methanomicrobiaceae archaeon]|nr:hypothetical protein [Methanomicrobiaceae archaeon]